jgi:hypothetical protein
MEVGAIFTANVFNGNLRAEAIYDFQGSTAMYSRAETAYNSQHGKRTLKSGRTHGSGHSRAADNSGVYRTSLKNAASKYQLLSRVTNSKCLLSSTTPH